MDKIRVDPALLVIALGSLAAGIIASLIGRHDLAHGLWGIGAMLVALTLAVEIVIDLVRHRMGVDLIALLSIAGALFFSEYLVASVVGVMLASGRNLEYFSSQRAARELKRLIQRAPTFAWRIEGGDLTRVPLQEVVPGQLILVRMGDVIPLDGDLQGSGAIVDESALTGEPIPVNHRPGASIRSGGINVGTPFSLRVRRSAQESTYAGIVRMATQARQSRPPFVRAADRYALILIPVTLLIAGVSWAWSADPVRALAVLVVSTPCPLILAAPVAILSGISRCARRGILVRDGATLEAMARTQRVLFDKTGTLTAGRPSVMGAETRGDVDVQRMLYLAGSLAQGSPHPVSIAIAASARVGNVALAIPTQVVEQPGSGLSGEVEGHRVWLGGPDIAAATTDNWTQHLMSRLDFQGLGASLVVVDNQLAGAILFTDPLRKESARALRHIKQMGLDKIAMLTGDRLETAELVAVAAGVDDVRAGLSPEEKVRAVQQSCVDGITMMVGDGINDAPALAAADVGVAMGANGASAASESAGVVLLVDRLDRVVEALEISKRTYTIARQSLLIGMGLSVTAMLIAAAGYLPPLAGAILQEGIDVGVILNALRALGAARGQGARGLPDERLDRLAAEHLNMKHILQQLSSMAYNFSSLPAEQATKELSSLLEQFDNELLPHEHDDEEQLYPSLVDYLKGDDPLGALSHTHRELFRMIGLLRRMNQQLATQPSNVDLKEIQILLIRLDTLLALHFSLEEELYQTLDLR
ncbi:heavy metal translocating P-type ATPase [Pseudomonas sp. 21LCFQ010]|uniref:heavy metal translocating P-type ATPase n=1 Tax=Pseudomonas sp. 21LCFQ010 TaxID=2957506 RepID=UPI00209754C8|nr:heavy metal translocating P-type ATPase [Pseudomonas sp. 21LCFQ010]MCO8165993.1 heavy metal translocating P-type ATPase [Pseudomonas sp. 21LCFQ010]